MNNSFRLLAFLLFISLTFFSCGKDEVPEPTIFTISTTSLRYDVEGGSQFISVTSNTSWTVESAASWLEVTPLTGTGNGQISIKAIANEMSDEKEASVTVRSGTIVQSIAVTQDAKAPSFPSYYIPSDATGMRDIPNLELAKEMGVGWNLGNSLEAIGGETAWGNPKTTKAFIDDVKAAGFNAVRIPVAWSKFSNASDYTIDPAWMARVQEVVDYVVENDMYALMNIHWDEGWMQPTFERQDYVNDRLEKMWVQIALNFRDYDDHLVFAGTNEVHVEGDYGTPSAENLSVQNSFNQTFVDAVRSTGGRNTYRNLAVQAYNTNIDLGVNEFVMPEDQTENRLMVEVHYYDPYEFSLQENETITQWGQNATDPSKTASWGAEEFADGQFQKMKTNFIDKGIPVLLGEYAATDKKADDNDIYREYYLDYITKSILDHGLVPFYWDNGYAGDYGSALFERNTGEQIYPDLVKAIIQKD